MEMKENKRCSIVDLTRRSGEGKLEGEAPSRKGKGHAKDTTNVYS
jgi:hypothetical protein